MRTLATVVAMSFAVGAVAATPSAAEVDRLRMHASAGRDDAALGRLRTLAATQAPGALTALGLALLARNEPRSGAEAARLLEIAATRGDGSAMLALGKAQLLGAPGIAREPSAAARWFDRAANAGDAGIGAQAAYYQAVIARGGHGQPADPKRAVELFTVAAQAGIADAMFQLGNANAIGEGVDADAREAMRWYLRAAALDHPGAIQELAFAFERGDTLLPRSELQANNMRLAMEHALRHPRPAP